MKVSLKWLSQYVDVPADTKALCDKLDLTGTGVEGVEERAGGFTGVYIGEIVGKVPHPNSDHMFITQVNVGERNVNAQGEPESLQIVCGAQNFNEGDRVPVAMIGAELPVGKIKKSKLRGEVSMGMNCGPRDLGFEGDNYGLIILPEDAPLGMDYAQYAGLSDRVLDLEITPNRPDCLSMEGMAREMGAMYRVPVKAATEGVELVESAPATDSLVEVEVADASRCPRYTARVIRNVKVGPSPEWLAERITAAGARPINNVVDITNYVLFLLGQPLHAFDFDKVAANGKAHIVVRAAEDGEKLTTLDGEERELTNDMTVIATPERAIALAGVMGGLETEVSDETTTVLLEAATFSPAHTSRTSRNLGLISESSMRYERRVDDVTIARNADFAAALIAQVCGGEVSEGLVDQWLQKTEPHTLTYRHDRCRQMMGADIPAQEAVDILERLGCAVALSQGETYTVFVPTFRPDLEREIDLYEEVLRLYGMEKVPGTLPGGRGRIGKRTWEEQVTAKLHLTMRASGVNETQTYAFANPTDMERLRMVPAEGEEAVELINPINADQSVMRQSLVPGLLRSVAYNQNHGVANIQLYEVGNVFAAHEGRKLPRQRTKIACVLAGAMTADGWNVAARPFDFFDGKGILENIVRELALPKARFKALDAEAAPFLQPGRAAELQAGGAQVGWVGEIHPLAADAFEANAPVVAFELDLETLVKIARFERETEAVPEFPPASIDVAFVVDEAVTCERLMQCMTSAGGKLLGSAHLFDVYRDEERLGAGKKSMAFALEYRAADHTLSGEEIEKAHNRLVKKVCAATGAEVRS
ncbi:phenylalanine--tRNA ligase subunit beta [Denitrobacterium detoxificans]|uniref:phenylalanine--tRNA ligase subunit beta n=1 Tax=Denitrobacterium detoxificans TaxID=79604 RepID=UPI0026EB6B5E|nr:phenylalanine--tRNA ligase subunit beta [Denitrobacterium detoxificans]MBE6466359.1 phenylalanine--tRNA ligase subunit beta [Denitrobacterium detoxificans]